MGLRRKFLDVVLGDLPDPTSTISETSNPDRWDHILGGKLGPGRWKRFETGYGTTCGVAANGWLIDAGAPPVMINAAPPEGSGFTNGAHISRINSGASDPALGWLRTVQRGQLPDFRPGDLYEINHTTNDGTDGTHIGVVLAVTPSADGQSLTVDTADGGQGTRQAQYAGRNTRTFTLSSGPHPVTVQSKSGAGWLDRWVRLGGDEDLGPGGAPGTEPIAVGGDQSGADWTVAALLGVGGALLLAGGVWFSLHGERSKVNALYELGYAVPARRYSESLR